MREPSVIALANKHVRIEQAVRWAGAEVDDVDTGTSVKVYCPFGEVYHTDQGMTAALRVYPDSNSAWCFACNEYYTPVRICAQAWGQPWEQVAVELLQRVGYKPATYAQLWQQVASPPPDPGHEGAEAALQVWLERQPGWQAWQYDERVAAYRARLLGLLKQARTEAESEEWLEGAKKVMSTVLGKVAAGGTV